MHIGNAMKAARMKAGLTQVEAARLIGVSRQTLSNWENERTYADVTQLLIVSRVYNTAVDNLLKDTATIEPISEKDVDSSPPVMRIELKWIPLVLFGIAVVLLCFLTWYTEIRPFQKGYSPGPLTVLWIYMLLPIVSVLTTIRISAYSRWKAGMWVAVAVVSCIQAGVQYYWLYQANLFHNTYANKPIDYAEMLTETMSNFTITLLLGVGIGTLIRFVKPKVTSWLKGID